MQNIFFHVDKTELNADYLEIKRYLGYKKSTPIENELQSLIEECSVQMQNVLVPNAVYQKHELCINECISFADLNINSINLKTNLKNCTQVVIFAATIGPMVDTLIRRSQCESQLKAAVMQATGAMFIEKFVDILNDEISKQALLQHLKSHPRFSPGYGDVSLNIQKEFFRLLPCNKFGLTLMDSLIMAPEKSVTAFIGLEPIQES